MKDCPVCEKPGLPGDADRCPQCGADLECFELLGDLRESTGPGEGVRLEKGGFPSLPKVWWLLPASLLILLVGSLLSSAYLGMRVDQLIDRFDLRMEQLTSRLTALASGPGPAPGADRGGWAYGDGLPGRFEKSVPEWAPPWIADTHRAHGGDEDNAAAWETAGSAPTLEGDLELKTPEQKEDSRLESGPEPEFAPASGDGSSLERIADLEQRRLAVRERVRAALAKYRDHE